MAAVCARFGFLFLLIALVNGQSRVTVSGRNIYVNGTQFYARGFAFSPVQIGTSPGSQDLFSNANRPKWELHLNAIKAAGANVVRIYTDLGGAGPYDQFLTVCASKKIFVILNYMTPSGAVLTNPTVLATAKNATLAMVRRYTNYTAILGWALGNELNHGYSTSDFVSFTKTVINYVRTTFTETYPHPFISPLADNFASYISAYEASTSPGTVDVWGLQIYRGASLSTTWSSYAAASSRPMLITEYGNDAYNTISASEDATSQNLWIGYQTVDIESHSVGYSGGVNSGGLVFEWNDEWWKLSNGSTSTHDTAGNADILGPPPHSFDNYVSPEWYGVVKLTTSTPNNITTRTIYNTLKTMWTNCTYPQFNPIDKGNAIVNGGFDVADTFYEYSSPLHFTTDSAIGKSLKISNIVPTDHGWDCQIKNPTSSSTSKLTFTKGVAYNYTYKARTATSTRLLYSYISNGTWPPVSGTATNGYGRDQCSLTTSWTTCKFLFTPTQTFPSAQLYIEFGNSSTVAFELDDIFVSIGNATPPNTGPLKLCG